MWRRTSTTRNGWSSRPYRKNASSSKHTHTTGGASVRIDMHQAGREARATCSLRCCRREVSVRFYRTAHRPVCRKSKSARRRRRPAARTDSATRPLRPGARFEKLQVNEASASGDPAPRPYPSTGCRPTKNSRLASWVTGSFESTRPFRSMFMWPSFIRMVGWRSGPPLNPLSHP